MIVLVHPIVDIPRLECAIARPGGLRRDGGDRLCCPQPVEVHKSVPPEVIVVVPRTELPIEAKAALALPTFHCVYDLQSFGNRASSVAIEALKDYRR